MHFTGDTKIVDGIGSERACWTSHGGHCGLTFTEILGIISFFVSKTGCKCTETLIFIHTVGVKNIIIF